MFRMQLLSDSTERGLQDRSATVARGSARAAAMPTTQTCPFCAREFFPNSLKFHMKECQKRAENRLAFKPSMRKGDRTGPVPTEKAREATKSECRRALAESTGLDRSVTETSEAD